jgi:hypothetical protein
MDSNMSSVASACEEATTNVNMVAAATEEMTVTIRGIAQKSEESRTISESAVSKASDVSEKLGRLGQGAQEISCFNWKWRVEINGWWRILDECWTRKYWEDFQNHHRSKGS